jgi:ribonuclease P protein component
LIKRSIKQFTLNKNERLKKRTTIDRLFKEGRSFSVYPFKAVYHLGQINEGLSEKKNVNKAGPPLQFGVSVSKRTFKKAVFRNRVKRLIREAYRVEKVLLLTALNDKKNTALELFIIYTGKELPLFTFVQEKMKNLIHRLVQEIEKRP